ncbi:hypothetical protein [Deinococcus ficus]|uniref:Lipoprotein n=1 Tax=Deinococcus ficus TaxID=317577 RepID=A0A221ST06_9DEIO|nr:hypothetical protein [Deinococcus ficus]ASN79778.1 hypothetical protein DFI_01040 [Deinococcus ficus]
MRQVRPALVVVPAAFVSLALAGCAPSVSLAEPLPFREGQEWELKVQAGGSSLSYAVRLGEPVLRDAGTRHWTWKDQRSGDVLVDYMARPTQGAPLLRINFTRGTPTMGVCRIPVFMADGSAHEFTGRSADRPQALDHYLKTGEITGTQLCTFKRITPGW